MGFRRLWANVPHEEIKEHCRGCEFYEERRMGYWRYELCRPICINDRSRHSQLMREYYHRKKGALYGVQ
jgi:hypothetical protein